MEVGLSIAQMQRGMDVEGFYLLKAAFAKATASGKPFLSAVLADTSGTIEAKVWDYSGPIGERDVGKVLKVRGSVSDYRGMLQLTVDKLRLAEDNDRVDVSKLVSVAPIDREAGYDEVKALVSTIEDADYRAVCEEMLRRHEAAFRTIPAAKSVHHGFLSGLLMHTLNMLRLADFLSAQYADTVNRSLLLTGTLLHDFAKEQEFTFSELGLVTDYSTKGQLLGHLVMGAQEVAAIAAELDLPEERATLLITTSGFRSTTHSMLTGDEADRNSAAKFRPPAFKVSAKRAEPGPASRSGAKCSASTVGRAASSGMAARRRASVCRVHRK